MTTALKDPPKADVAPLTVTTTHGNLSAALTAVSAAVSPRPPVPILGGVRLDTDNDGTYVTGFDFRTLVQARIAAPAAGAPVLLPKAALHSIVRSLVAGSTRAKMRDEQITITGGEVHTADGYTFTLPPMPIADYPDFGGILTAEPDHALTVDRDVLAQALTRALVSAGRDDTLPMLTGVNVRVAGQTAELATTDRFRLGVAPIPVHSEGEWSTLIPARTLATIVRSLPAGEVLIERLGADIFTGGKPLTDQERRGRRVGKTSTGTPAKPPHAHDGWARITSGPITAAIRCIDHEFVTYEKLIPTSSPEQITVDRRQLLTAAYRGQATLGRYGHLRLTLDKTRLTVNSGDADDGSTTSPPIPVDGLTGDMLIAFNPGYLIDALTQFKSDRIAVALSSPTRPIVLAETVAQLADGTGFRHLIMPARLPDRTEHA